MTTEEKPNSCQDSCGMEGLISDRVPIQTVEFSGVGVYSISYTVRTRYWVYSGSLDKWILIGWEV